MNRHSLMLIAPRQLKWFEQPIRNPAANEIVVRTRTSAISNGTEMPLYRGEQRSSTLIKYPHMTGYENVGEVIACGDRVTDIRVGQRVIGFYGHRTHAVIPAAKAIPVPDDIPDELAILVILACDVAKGISRVSPQPDENILVAGCGTVGLLTVFNLKASGSQRVHVAEPIELRREIAHTLGADAAFSPQGSITYTYQIGFECSSQNTAFALLQRKMRQDGRICILADGNTEPLTLLPDFHEKELRVIGSSDGLNYHEYAAWFFGQIRTVQPPLANLLNYRIAAGELPQTFEQIANGDIHPIKVLVNYENYK